MPCVLQFYLISLVSPTRDKTKQFAGFGQLRNRKKKRNKNEQKFKMKTRDILTHSDLNLFKEI